MRSGRVLAAATVTASSLLFGCADTPDRDATTTGNAAFDDLPLYPRSEPFGRPSTQDGIVTRSYQADGATTPQVIDFYRDALTERGWEEVEPAYRSDAGNRTDFINEEQRLEVSAVDADRAASTDDKSAGVQYSLVLRPR